MQAAKNKFASSERICPQSSENVLYMVAAATTGE